MWLWPAILIGLVVLPRLIEATFGQKIGFYFGFFELFLFGVPSVGLFVATSVGCQPETLGWQGDQPIINDCGLAGATLVVVSICLGGLACSVAISLAFLARWIRLRRPAEGNA